MMPTIRTLPRSTFNAYLRALRLPVTVAERVAGQRDNESWAPALAFEKLEARLETIAGSLLRDEELRDAGEQRDAKVLKLKEAQALEAAAEYERTQARQEQRDKEAEIARQRKQTARAARERKDSAQAAAAKRKQAAESAAAKREAEARKKEAAQQKVIDRNERAGKAEALRSESEALDLTDEALEAKETVDLIEATLDGNKEARKTG
jgi:colicin import membrane protein